MSAKGKLMSNNEKTPFRGDRVLRLFGAIVCPMIALQALFWGGDVLLRFILIFAGSIGTAASIYGLVRISKENR